MLWIIPSALHVVPPCVKTGAYKISKSEQFVIQTTVTIKTCGKT